MVTNMISILKKSLNQVFEYIEDQGFAISCVQFSTRWLLILFIVDICLAFGILKPNAATQMAFKREMTSALKIWHESP